MVKICVERFNYVIREKTRVLDHIFHLALPKQKNPLAKLSDLPGINNEFINSIRED
jgi:hypothetical protein